MTDLAGLLLDWRLFVIALVVFGVAPGLVLRVVVLAYPRSHPRRRELVAELYAVPYVERPWFVAQHLERAVFDGTAARRQAARERRQEAEPATVSPSPDGDWELGVEELPAIAGDSSPVVFWFLIGLALLGYW